jgi:hypothetical protein
MMFPDTNILERRLRVVRTLPWGIPASVLLDLTDADLDALDVATGSDIEDEARISGARRNREAMRRRYRETHGLKNTETESSVSGAKKETVNPSHMQSPKKADPHDPGGDWRDHPLSCGCLRCSAPPPRYVTPFTGVAT